MNTLQQTELLPWHAETYQHLCELDREQRLAHAYLFEGQLGLGKVMLAKHFAHYLLCQSPNKLEPCRHCDACHLIAAGTHPDFKLVMPQDSKNIKIDQIRETLSFMDNTSLRGGRKVIILAPAESMNINSANALLKALEEPSPGTLIILVSHQPALLMATIKSRCQKTQFVRPPTTVACDWLQSKNITSSAEKLLSLANGAPLKALQMADEDASHERAVLHATLESLLSDNITIVEAASECGNFEIKDNIEGMMLCISDLLGYLQTNEQTELHDPDILALATRLNGGVNIQVLHKCYKDLLNARAVLNTTANPSVQLILESLFYQWSCLQDVSHPQLGTAFR